MAQSDPAPLPYGALQYYQVHYIVAVESEENHSLLARCTPITQGHFKNKRVVGLRWVGAGRFAERLHEDSKLNGMLKEVLFKEGEIRVDPQDDHIRIHARWVHEDRLGFDKTMFEVADRIAMHVRQRLSELGVKT